MNRLSTDEEVLRHLLARRPILDVRAPTEFADGSTPNSFNIPLLDDEQRAQVGTLYKRCGPEAALALGHQLISGEVQASRIAAWSDFFHAHPAGAIMCFRGGQRSQLVQAELLNHGFDQPLIDGGFKRVRGLLSKQLDEAAEKKTWRVISGFTGAGKTRVMRTQNRLGFLDLEKAARHRGSSFGTWNEKQPSPVTFQNELAIETCRLIEASIGRSVGEIGNPIWIEDESKSIGKLVLPPKLFAAISKSKVWILEKPRAERAVSLTKEYLSENYGLSHGVTPDEAVAEKVALDIRRAILNIERRLGGLETKNLLAMAEEASREFTRDGKFSAHWPWVERVLASYYDPLYEKHLASITDRVVGRGPEEALRALAEA